MACNKCGISVMIRPLERVNEPGEIGIFWCMPCIEKHEPELAANIKEDQTEAEKDLKTILYGGSL